MAGELDAGVASSTNFGDDLGWLKSVIWDWIHPYHIQATIRSYMIPQAFYNRILGLIIR